MKALSDIISCSALTVIILLAVNGCEGMGNILKFLTGFFMVAYTLLILNPNLVAKVANKGRSLPAFISHTWGVILVGILVWHGWIMTGLCFLILEIFEAAIYSTKPQQQL